MQIARVVGNVVSTLRHPALDARRVLLVQPYDLDGKPSGRKVAAVDVVDAGAGEWVLVLDEGASASQVLGLARGPVRTLVIGVVDEVMLEDGARAWPGFAGGGRGAAVQRGAPRLTSEAAPEASTGGPSGETPGDAAIQDGTRG